MNTCVLWKSNTWKYVEINTKYASAVRLHVYVVTTVRDVLFCGCTFHNLKKCSDSEHIKCNSFWTLETHVIISVQISVRILSLVFQLWTLVFYENQILDTFINLSLVFRSRTLIFRFRTRVCIFRYFCVLLQHACVQKYEHMCAVLERVCLKVMNIRVLILNTSNASMHSKLEHFGRIGLWRILTLTDSEHISSVKMCSE